MTRLSAILLNVFYIKVYNCRIEIWIVLEERLYANINMRLTLWYIQNNPPPNSLFTTFKSVFHVESLMAEKW